MPGPKKPRKITESYLHNAGLHYLQRFSTGTENFRRVMKRKIERSCNAHAEQSFDQCIKMLNELIEKFQRSGLLDDRNYTTGAIRSLRQKGVSSRAILQKMHAKGISAELATDAVRKHDADENYGGDMAAAARYVRRRKLGPFSTRIKEDREEKDLASLARAGYNYEVSQKILCMAAEEIERLITAGSG